MGRNRHLVANGRIRGGFDAHGPALAQERRCAWVELKGFHLADGRHRVDSERMGCHRVELALKGLQLVCAEVPLKHLKALGMGKTSGLVAGKAQRHQVMAAVALVVVEHHGLLPGRVEQQDP